jgi:hypothetical protein
MNGMGIAKNQNRSCLFQTLKKINLKSTVEKQIHRKIISLSHISGKRNETDDQLGNNNSDVITEKAR